MTSKDVELISEAQNKFARDLYGSIAKNTVGNVFFSPFSISVALAMTHLGSKDKTEEQMRNSLYLPSELDIIQNAHRELLNDLKKPSSEYQLNSSNSAYVSHDLPVLDSYINALSGAFLADVENVNFGNDEVRQKINQKVEEDTNKKIKDLIPQGMLTADTKLVLVNAVYFKGLWDHKFKSSNTAKKPFWISETDSVPVDMMFIKEKFRMVNTKDLDATMLAMDYKGSRLSFVVILPNKRGGIADLEKKLSSFDLKNLDVKGHSSEIEVSLPKFKLEQSLSLESILAELGMKDLFSAQHCDLSGITGQKDLFVSNVVHKSFIEVNEEGSEAAAATAILMMRCAMVRPKYFTADHPFIFSIRDNVSGAILFLGKYANP